MAFDKLEVYFLNYGVWEIQMMIEFFCGRENVQLVIPKVCIDLG